MNHDLCTPWWVIDAAAGEVATCPYGRKLPGDVTLPHDANPMEWIAVVYSYVPWLVIFGVIFELIFRRGTRQVLVLGFTVLSTSINELVVKRLILAPRPGAYGPAPGAMTNINGVPIGSCCTTCGMPSSHATMSVGFLMLCLMDGILRIVPSQEALSPGWSKDKPFSRRTCWSMVSLTPLLPHQSFEQLEFIAYFVIWFCLLIPVPMMRVRTHDHTASQAYVGGWLGGVEAILWFRFMRFLANKYRHHLGKTFCCGLIVHDYGPIAFRVQTKAETSEDWDHFQGPTRIVSVALDELRGEFDDEESHANSDTE
mmetsp:Transcript_76488/g.134941  ORF Transcript_76488/g.134941 Transcript_76488/m.134941 type:complete len:312 (-) Transcript_76488:37-972(-)